MPGQNDESILGQVRRYVAQHELAAFFVFVIAISWTAWFLFPYSNGFSALGGYGPLFAAVAVAALMSGDKNRGFLERRILLFCGAFILAMLVWLGLAVIPGAPRYAVWTGAIVSALVALALSGFYSARSPVRAVLAPVAAWRVGWLPWAAVFILAPMLLLLGVLVDLALGGSLGPLPLGAPSAVVYLAVFGVALFSGGGMEEVGWRGFALPRLQKRYSPLVASLIVGVIWAVWHIPLYFNGQYGTETNTGPAALTGILFRLQWSLPLSVIFTWLYNRSRGSLLILMLFHALFNWTTAVVPLSYRAGAITFMATFWLAALVVIFTDRMWRKTQEQRPAALAPQHATA